MPTATESQDSQAILKGMIKAYLGIFAQFGLQTADQIEIVEILRVSTRGQGAENIVRDPTPGQGADVRVDYLSVEVLRSSLYGVTDQPQGLECKCTHVPLPVSTIFILLVYQPFGSSDGWTG